ncbi:MAG: calcium/sodium antiporter [Rikenellaceae bacterium]|nr:calcium/sodium antiporter [Rikenellaceae bacterium]
MNILLMLVGLALILIGANYLTEGASDLARRMRISDFVIGVTVVAIGTSFPELVISVMSGMEGKGDVAIGNIVGSNLFNTLLILGVTALILPLRYTRNNLRADIPFGILASVVLFIVASDTLLDGAKSNYIGRNEGLLMLGYFVIFIIYTIYTSRGSGVAKVPEAEKPKTESAPAPHKRKIWLSLLMIGGGLAGLIYGGNLFLDKSLILARSIGVSESVIAVTLLAGGTSLPEFFVSVVSAIKKKPGMALGNVIGSNICNIFLVLGLSATVSPLTPGDIIPLDMVVLIASSVLLFTCAYTFRKKTLDRFEGAIFILLYFAYIYWLLNR